MLCYVAGAGGPPCYHSFLSVCVSVCGGHPPPPFSLSNTHINSTGGWDATTSAIPSPSSSPTALASQISNAFSNVQLALTHAGSQGWAEVYKVRCYVGPPGLDEEVMGLLLTELRKWCPDHRPVLTGVAVAGLWEGMRLELEVKACVRRRGEGRREGAEKEEGGKKGWEDYL